MKKKNKIRLGLLGAAILVFGLFFGKRDTEIQNSFQNYEESITKTDTESAASGTKEAASLPASTEKQIYVYITGAVQNPGVYKLPENARVFEAVELAGGFTEEANLLAINQAVILSDGYHLHIPKIGEEYVADEGTSSGGTSSGKVNLNKATLQELTTLSGIGESKAKAILSYREENGPFSCIEDLLNVSGIGEGIFSKIKDLIEV